MAKDKEKETSLSKKSETVLATVDKLLPDGKTFEDLKQNLEGMEDINFPRIRVLNDGHMYTSADSSSKTTELEGIILHYTRQNTYWAKGFDKNNTAPPECVSLDGKTGSKYGDCRTCQFNKFGSAKTGKGKACRNQIKLSLQLDGYAIPFVLFIAPANLKAFNENFMQAQVTQKVLAFWQVRVKITSYKEEADQQHTNLKFEVVGVYKDKELETVKEIKSFWGNIISQDTGNLGEDVASGSVEIKESSPSGVGASGPPSIQVTGKVVTPKAKVENISTVSNDDPPF